MRVRKALADPSLVLLPESERVGVRSTRVHASPEEWNKIGLELLKRGVVSEVAREDAPVVDGQAVLVGAFGVEKRGVPQPPATRVLRLIVNGIPSNKQQTAIKGDIEQMPVGGEWLHIALETDEIVLWSSDDIQGCFHVFSLPPSWRRWMILSKPIRVATPGISRVSTSEDNLCHPCAASGTMGHGQFREVWLALAVIPMGWLSAVGVIQHLHRNIISRARHVHGGLDPNAELVRGLPIPVTFECSTRWWWKVYVDNFDDGEIFSHSVAAEVVHTESLSQAVYRVALNNMGVPRAPEKGVSRDTIGITMGSMIDGIDGRAAPSLRKMLDHISLTSWVLAQSRVCRLWLQAAGRWVFDFQHRRPCFAALDQIWDEIAQFQGWRPMSTTCADELLSCICFVPLIYTDMRAQFSSHVYCTDASPSGGGACMSVGLGMDAGRGEMFRSGKTRSREIPADLAAKALVLGLLRRADHRGTDVRIDVQLPFRSDAWPRSPICLRKWFWKIILSFPWKRPGAHINELELRAFVLSPSWSFKIK